MLPTERRGRILWWPLLALVAVAGCTSSELPPQASPDQARIALAAALDAWQRGEPVEALTGNNPPIHFNDSAAGSGAQLLSYTLTEGHEMYGQSVRLTASLSLKLPDGTTKVRKASYLVDTTPAVVIVPG